MIGGQSWPVIPSHHHKPLHACMSNLGLFEFTCDPVVLGCIVHGRNSNENINYTHMWVWLVAPPLFENPGSCPDVSTM